MIITFDDRVVADLDFLAPLDVAYLAEFTSIAVEFTLHGAKPKMFARAAASMKVPQDIVANGASALSAVLLQATKANISKASFLLSMADFKFSDDHKAALAEQYGKHRKAIRASLATHKMKFPSYRKLDWRLDVELGTRSVRAKADPSFLLRLDTQSSATVSSTYLQSDYANLKRLVAALKAAEAEMQNSHSKRVARYIR